MVISPACVVLPLRFSEFYGLSASVFPAENFYTRGSDLGEDSTPNKLVYVSSAVKRIIDANAQCNKYRVCVLPGWLGAVCCVWKEGAHVAAPPTPLPRRLSIQGCACLRNEVLIS